VIAKKNSAAVNAEPWKPETWKTYVWKIDLKQADLSSHVQELSSEDDDAVL
jgi:hypothetical protein